jgi:hypothetical protein
MELKRTKIKVTTSDCTSDIHSQHYLCIAIKYDNPFKRFGKLTTFKYFANKNHVEEFIKMGVRNGILEKIKDDIKGLYNYKSKESEMNEFINKLTVKLTYDLDKE